MKIMEDDDADRISQLPEPIMEQILFRLPAMDAIRMSLSSRTWQSLWNSLPVSDFDFLTDPAFGRYRYGHYGGHVPYFYNHSRAKKLITRIDESLKILEEQEPHHHKRIINSFRLRGTLFRNEYEAMLGFEPWIRLVTSNYVKVLDLNFKAVDRRRLTPWFFPYSLGVDATSLVVLRLSYCLLEPRTKGLPEDKRFPCLKELSLCYVKFSGSLVDQLLSRCPSLETLNLDHCYNFKSLQLCGLRFPKLHTVLLLHDETLDYKIETLDYKIELPNLQTLGIEFVHPRYDDLGQVCCSNVKTLRVCAPPNEFINTNQYLEKLISKFPLLEDLTLTATFESAQTKISSHQLKKLAIIANARTANQYGYTPELNLDTPNLHCFLCNNCAAHIIHSNISLNSTRLELVNLELRIGRHVHLGTPWFLGLQEYLRNFTPNSTMNLTIKPLNNVSFSLEELREEKLLPLPQVQDLCLEDIPAFTPVLDYTNLIDGLLWSFHPITLSVQVVPGHSPNNKLIKFIYKKLICREENPLCCTENHVKCWRHYLKSIQIQSFTKDGQNTCGRELSSLLANLKQVQKVTFELQWLSNN